MLVEPTPLRSVLSESPDGLRIRIPAPRNIFVALFLLVWLAGWWIGEREVGSKFLRGIDRNLFTTVWLAFWTVAGPVALYFWLWNLFGDDVVTVSPSMLTVRNQVLGIGRTRLFDVRQVRNLRFRPAVGRGRGHTQSVIVFDYGAKTQSFANGIDEAEAGQIIDLIRQRAAIPKTETHADYSEHPSQTWPKS